MLPATPAPRLYFTTIPKSLVKFGVRVMPLLRQDPRKFGRNKDIDLVQIASWDVPPTTQINTQVYVPVKIRASACHVVTARRDASAAQSAALLRPGS